MCLAAERWAIVSGVFPSCLHGNCAPPLSPSWDWFVLPFHQRRASSLRFWSGSYPTGCQIESTHHWGSLRGAAETNPTRIREDAGLIPGLAQRVGDLALP